MLRGKKILLGVTGSIAAYKACDLIQRLKDEGCDIRVAMTPEATQLVHPNSLAALSGHAVLLDAWSGVADGRMDHISAARWADLFVVAPATAEVIGELAHGLTTTMVSLLALAFAGPVLLAPAMNTQMLHHPAVAANLQLLQTRGVTVLPSGEGVLACGEVGEGKLLEVGALVAHLRSFVAQAGMQLGRLRGKRVLLSLGHTQEPIDAVRFISNRSSGKTGLALARALWLSGAKVDGVVGHLDLPVATQWASLTQVKTSADFAQVLFEKGPQADIVIQSAAIADFVPTPLSQGKSKDSKSLQNLELKPSVHILTELGHRKKPGQILVGFALETENLEAEAQRKMLERHCDFMVVNQPVMTESGFGKNEVLAGILAHKPNRKTHTQNGSHWALSMASVAKEALASALLLALQAALETEATA
jgi:phosphopantothenoylcysteine decarboxylase / phosphopantothenate---cysteine ligase